MLNRLFAILMLSCSLMAAKPIATLTAGPGVTMNGRPLETTGAPNWPVSVKDKIATGDAAAVITFANGTTLTLGPNTKVAFQQCDRVVVQLFEGSVEYRMPADSSLEFCASGRPVQPARGASGSIVIQTPEQVLVKTDDEVRVVSTGTCSCDAGAPWFVKGMSAKSKVAIAVAAAAAATGATVAITTPAKTSPTR
jgi:hypothetical protein